MKIIYSTIFALAIGVASITGAQANDSFSFGNHDVLGRNIDMTQQADSCNNAASRCNKQLADCKTPLVVH